MAVNHPKWQSIGEFFRVFVNPSYDKEPGTHEYRIRPQSILEMAVKAFRKSGQTSGVRRIEIRKSPATAPARFGGQGEKG